MRIIIDRKLKEIFPDLKVLAVFMEGLKITMKNPEIESLKASVVEEVKSKYKIETLREVLSVRAYRDFFWRIGIDPTKNRPAAEALIRRILLGKPLPSINTFVDSLNISSIKSEVAIGSFDADRIVGDRIILRYACKGEEFYGIGMNKPAVMSGCEIVLSDEAGLIAIYPHRDSERTKITEATRRAIIIFCGAPGIGIDMLKRAMSITTDLITRFCGGKSMSIEVE